MSTAHAYALTVTWTGNNGEGTKSYTGYERSHTISIKGKPDLLCSSDVPFRGDGSKHNPEDFFLASLSTCHMLWYLHLCADAGVIVTDYTDHATGTLSLKPGEPGRFTEVTLHPKVTVKEESMIEKANALHHEANKKCFMANSVNFKVLHEPVCEVMTK
jgi:organic hydroperoxide reductase OsmC/OhrA